MESGEKYWDERPKEVITAWQVLTRKFNVPVDLNLDELTFGNFISDAEWDIIMNHNQTPENCVFNNEQYYHLVAR